VGCQQPRTGNLTAAYLAASVNASARSYVFSILNIEYHYCPVKDNTKPPEVLKIKG